MQTSTEMMFMGLLNQILKETGIAKQDKKKKTKKTGHWEAERQYELDLAGLFLGPLHF